MESLIDRLPVCVNSTCCDVLQTLPLKIVEDCPTSMERERERERVKQ